MASMLRAIRQEFLRRLMEVLMHRPSESHLYLSTACLHAVVDNRPELHAHCEAMVGTQGEKRPAECKWCDAKCLCDCHVVTESS